MQFYLDTSIFGGYFEDEFSEWSTKLIHSIENGEHYAIISDITIKEIEKAPEHVFNLFQRVIQSNAEFVLMDKRAEDLANLYLKEKIVSQKYKADALHIAIATVNKIDVLVSWNFKHIVHLDKIRLYNAVNLKYGYSIIEIRSPREIV